MLVGADQACIVVLQDGATADQVPVDDLEKLLFEQVDLWEADAAYFCIVLVGVEGITERFGRTEDGSADEAMDGEAADGEALEALAYTINVDEEDEDAAFVERGVFCDTAEVGRERDVGSSSGVKAGQGGRVKWKGIVVLCELYQHIYDEDEDILELCIVEEIREHLGVGWSGSLCYWCDGWLCWSGCFGG